MNFNQLMLAITNSESLQEKQGHIEEYLYDFVPKMNPFLNWTDSYKVSHILFEIDGVESIYSNATNRFAHYMRELLGDVYDDKYVVFGIQWMMLRLHCMAKKGFFGQDKKEVIDEMRQTHKNYIGEQDLSHFEALHDLGYLPIVVKSLDEGTIAPIGIPFYTIENTHPDFEWLPNFLESGMSTDTWKQMAVATVAYYFHEISKTFAMRTQGNHDGVAFQNHDFSTRGQSGFESGAINGVGFLLSSHGTDNLPALWAAKHFYFSQNEEFGSLAASVPAGEHSVTTLGIIANQVKAVKENGEHISKAIAEQMYTEYVITERFPNGIVSFVADSYDYWNFITVILPALYDQIMNRDGKFVVRGDSGNPVHIIAGYRILDLDVDLYKGKYRNWLAAAMNVHQWWKEGTEVVKFQNTYYLVKDVVVAVDNERLSEEEAKGTIEMLWSIFGGTVNDLGFRHLDSHIGMIYGDGITPQRSIEILSRLEQKGYASTNIVFGVGSYSLNMLSRDHLGMAIKATHAEVLIGGEVEGIDIYKDPKTDQSKKSDKGYLVVDEDEFGIFKRDQQTKEAMQHVGLLTTLYQDGQFFKLTNVQQIREKLHGK